MWYVYILLCRGNSYYIGITNDLERRFKDHQEGKGGAYTKSHKPIRLVYSEPHPDRSSALKREIQLKKLSRIKKEKLVAEIKITL
ncbi:hypothetical protein A2972_03990 [Candidatus Amesbacteria bacterium RIFCSPLOWO2_01_FULL_47_33]|uniref:GIY-YIG domain-containing protein n=2 Tax=Candidatus Amesiibacteriota TaxID=1752730 RepID=A0A0G1U9I7_9BACT|nr:MAG: hypothetical protein UX86_C0042G0009 [Candidatus Amesbacteria bacterium GW2011_GWC1_47_15]OGD00778.1 MAG: hypothetical protein A2972_03990 [Candidatus Amesbacteria bacterium RIFCSPLOWO2_01_FULL_47_33]